MCSLVFTWVHLGSHGLIYVDLGLSRLIWSHIGGFGYIHAYTHTHTHTDIFLYRDPIKSNKLAYKFQIPFTFKPSYWPKSCGNIKWWIFNGFPGLGCFLIVYKNIDFKQKDIILLFWLVFPWKLSFEICNIIDIIGRPSVGRAVVKTVHNSFFQSSF